MNILYVTQNYETVQKHLYESLKSVATNVYLADYQSADNNIKEQFPEGVTYFNSRVKEKGFLFYTLKLWRIYVKCKEKYADTPLDIIHGNKLFCDGYICRKLSKLKNIPYCVSVRDTDINSKFSWKIPWIRRMGLRNIAEASAIIFLSEKYQEKLVEKVPKSYRESILKKSYIVPNGIDDYYIENAVYRNNNRIDVIRIISVGKISKRKNLETTIAACKLLIDSGKKVELNIIGPIVDREYDAMIKETPFVRYHGLCNKEQVLEHLRESDIFVMPSHTETFGLVYLEAMTQGLPVIYTRGQGFDGQFPEGTVGYAVSDEDPKEIADGVIAIIADYPILSKNATKCSTEFSWTRLVRQFMDIYQAIAKK